MGLKLKIILQDHLRREGGIRWLTYAAVHAQVIQLFKYSIHYLRGIHLELLPQNCPHPRKVQSLSHVRAPRTAYIRQKSPDELCLHTSIYLGNHYNPIYIVLLCSHEQASL